ncbi:hypothetical protein VTK73DRAFT_1768 [Phialemonium thermophilum]|uniref:Uncharacterized protein n=1 Tax=Phialemonium thermophilum TaxID=223376 RepID=A0ABR3VT14_9PEZI
MSCRDVPYASPTTNVLHLAHMIKSMDGVTREHLAHVRDRTVEETGHLILPLPMRFGVHEPTPWHLGHSVPDPGWFNCLESAVLPWATYEAEVIGEEPSCQEKPPIHVGSSRQGLFQIYHSRQSLPTSIEQDLMVGKNVKHLHTSAAVAGHP